MRTTISFERPSGGEVNLPAILVKGETAADDYTELVDAEIDPEVLHEFYAEEEASADYARESWAVRRAESGYAQ